MIRNVVCVLFGFVLGLLPLLIVEKLVYENDKECSSLINELYVNKPREGKLTEWIYEARKQSNEKVKSVVEETRELAYVFSAAYIGMTSSNQKEFVEKLKGLRNMLYGENN